MRFNGFEVAEGTCTHDGPLDAPPQIALIDRTTPADLAMAAEEGEPPRLEDGLLCAVARYVLRMDMRSGSEIAADYGIHRQRFNLLAVQLADRLGIPTDRGHAHREKKRKGPPSAAGCNRRRAVSAERSPILPKEATSHFGGEVSIV